MERKIERWRYGSIPEVEPVASGGPSASGDRKERSLVVSRSQVPGGGKICRSIWSQKEEPVIGVNRSQVGGDRPSNPYPFANRRRRGWGPRRFSA